MNPSIDEIEAAIANYIGWCDQCEGFTRDCTEPDAREYECPICGGNTVYGAGEALLEGMFQ